MPKHHSPAYRAILRYSRALHTYVSMLMLLGFTFFAMTGFMLNHPTWFGVDKTRTVESELKIPVNVLASKDKLEVVEFLRGYGVSGMVQPFDWPEEGEPFHIAFKAPASQCDVDISLPGGEAHLATETHGLAGILTRLHTAKEAGRVWRVLIDVTAVLLLFVCASGVILWQSLPRRRKIGSAAVVLSILTIAIVYAVFVP